MLGGVVLAGTIMIMNGVFQFFEGLAAVVKKDFYVAARPYVFEFNVTTWGWIHLILGVVLVVTGMCLLAGQTWARVAGVALAMLSAVSNFMFLPYYPIWAVVVILLDVLVIWALVAYEPKRAA